MRCIRFGATARAQRRHVGVVRAVQRRKEVVGACIVNLGRRVMGGEVRRDRGARGDFLRASLEELSEVR